MTMAMSFSGRLQGFLPTATHAQLALLLEHLELELLHRKIGSAWMCRDVAMELRKKTPPTPRG